MTIAFFTALLIGYFGYNFVLIMIQSILVPRIINMEMENGEVSGCLRLIDCLFVSEISKEVMRDILVISELK
jgi:hypothetical protein